MASPPSRVTTGSQTLPLPTREASTQRPPGVRDSGAQADGAGSDADARAPAEDALSFTTAQGRQDAARVLLGAGPVMLEELQRSADGLAGAVLGGLLPGMGGDGDDGEDGEGGGAGSGSSGSSAPLHAFSQGFVQPDEGADSGSSSGTAQSGRNAVAPSYLPCTGLSWNASGSLLAAAYGHAHHPGWCRHRAGVAVWNAFRGPPAAASSPSGGGGGGAWAPSAVLDTPTCVTSVAFHPDNAGLVAGGTATGEVYLWDLNRSDGGAGGPGKGGLRPTSTLLSDPLVCRSRTDDHVHREPVLSLAWAFDATLREYTLVSLSGEGKVAVWTPSANSLRHPVATAQMAVAKPRAAVRARAARGAGGKRGDGSDEDEGEEDDDGDGVGGGAGGGGGSNDPVARRAAARAAGTAGAAAGEVPIGGSALSFPLLGRQGTAGVSVLCGAGGGVFAATLPVSAAALAAAAHREGTPYRPVHKPGSIARAENSLPWEQAAVECLLRCPEADRARVCRAVERAAREMGAGAAAGGGGGGGAGAGAPASVTLPLLYDARPDVRTVLFPNPLRFALAPHTGAVLAAAASPFHRNLLATGGADGRLCLSSLLVAQPLLVLEPAGGGGAGGTGYGDAVSSTSSSSSSSSPAIGGLVPVTSCSWSRTRPLVLAAGCADGRVAVYDLYRSTGQPVTVLWSDAAAVAVAGGVAPGGPSHPTAVSAAAASASASSSSSSRPPVTSVAFNPRQRRVLATADSSGRILVWKLGWRFGRPEEREEVALERFLATATEVDAAADRDGKRVDDHDGDDRSKQQRVNAAGGPTPDLEGRSDHPNSLGALWSLWRAQEAREG
jgi:WD40 repeat protein